VSYSKRTYWGNDNCPIRNILNVLIYIWFKTFTATWINKSSRALSRVNKLKLADVSGTISVPIRRASEVTTSADRCGHGNQPSDYIKYWSFLDEVSYYHPQKMVAAVWSQFTNLRMFKFVLANTKKLSGKYKPNCLQKKVKDLGTIIMETISCSLHVSADKACIWLGRHRQQIPLWAVTTDSWGVSLSWPRSVPQQ
jgi:hypothetical protein